MNIRMMAAAAALAMPAIAFAAPPAPEYVMKAGASDLYEKESSQLVLQSTKDPAVRSFAQSMIRDHSKSTADVTAAATRSGLKPMPPKLDAKKTADVAALRKATGPARDRLYVRQQKAAHAEALALHRDYASTGDKPALKTVAGQIVPVVQHHGEMLAKMR